MRKMPKIEEWYNLEGRVVLLTGATGKLGPGYARVLSECGANVVLADLESARCKELEARLRADFGTEPLGLPMDITRKEEVERGVASILERFGRIDVLINNAAYHQLGHVVGAEVTGFEEFPLDLWQQTLDVNLTGAFLCCQAVGKAMVRQGGGVILNIASVYGVVAADQRIYGTSGLNSNVAYATTKSGLLNFTRFLASYWQGKNIRVNSLSPGGVFAGQDSYFLEQYNYRTMLGRMASPDDLSAAVLYLVSDASKFVTGFNLVVDGGFTAW